MKWDQDHESPDVIDRRGQSSGGSGAGLGILALLPFVKGRWGWTGVLVLVAIAFVGWRFLSSNASTDTPQVAGQAKPAGDTGAHFAGFVLDDTQRVWAARFAAGNKQWKNAKLVLYTDATPTGCGYGQAATGPFYCPKDQRVYLDLGFFEQLSKRLGARGDFAQAYVIAHEIGHHVQNELSLDNTRSLGAAGGSVRTELQADCYAGIWAHDTSQRNVLEDGDIGEAMTAAGSVGDDRLQKSGTGTVRPESFSHGTSAQRQHWFEVGYKQATIEACDTFKASSL